MSGLNTEALQQPIVHGAEVIVSIASDAVVHDDAQRDVLVVHAKRRSGGRAPIGEGSADSRRDAHVEKVLDDATLGIACATLAPVAEWRIVLVRQPISDAFRNVSGLLLPDHIWPRRPLLVGT